MSTVERKIKVSAEGNGVRSEFSRVRSDAKELARDMIRDAQEYSANSKELIRNLNEQVSALERRNRLEREGAQIAAERKLSTASTEEGKESAKGELRDIASADKENKQQVDLLKDIYLAILQSSREEIGANKENVQENLSRLQGIVGTKDDGRDAFEVLSSSYQNEQLSGRDVDGSGGGGFMRDAMSSFKEDNFVRMGADFGGKQAAKQAARARARGAAKLAKGMTIAGIIAGLVSMVADPARDENLGNLSRLTGSPVENVKGRKGINARLGQSGAGNMALSGFDVSLDEAIEQMLLPAIREGGSRYLNKQGINDAVAIDRGLGMEGATFAGFGRMQGGGGMIEIADQLFKGGRAAGTEEAFMSEFIELQKTLAQKQFQVLGSIDTGVNTKIVQQIAASDKAFSDPRILGQIVQSVDQAMRQSTTQASEAFSMLNLRQLFPDMSPLELLKEKEKGLAAGDGELYEKTINKVKGMGGGRLNQVRSIQSLFGIESVTMAEKLLNNEMSPQEAENEVNRQMGSDAKNRAKSADFGLNELKRQNANVSEGMKDLGKNISDLITTMKDFGETMSTIKIPDWLKTGLSAAGGAGPLFPYVPF